MKPITKKQLLNLDEMTTYFTELGRLLDVADIVLYDDSTKAASVSILIQNVIAVNRCFIKSLPLKESLLNKALLRLQIQNLIFLYAETKYPLKVVNPIFRKGKAFNQLGLPSLSSFITELESEYKGLKDLWNECCSFVHPSDNSLKLASAEHSLRLLSGIDESKQKPDILETLQAYVFLTTEALNKEAETDSKNMFHLNLLLIKIAKKQIALQKAKVWVNAKSRGFYKKVLADKVRMINFELPKEK
jgi:hypothetical protein